MAGLYGRRRITFPAAHHVSQGRGVGGLPIDAAGAQFIKFGANWSFEVIDMKRRVVAIRDESTGQVTSWKRTFGDGITSIVQNHRYETAGDYTVALEVDRPDGKAKREKIREVGVK
jgi:hypothetical protein